MNPYQPGEDNQDPYGVGFKAGAASRDVNIAELVDALEGHRQPVDSWGDSMSKQIDFLKRCIALNLQSGGLLDLLDRIEELERERDTAWAQAHRLALELECLIMDTKDNAVVSKWWDSAFEAIEEYQTLKPGADEEAEAWAKMRKEPE